MCWVSIFTVSLLHILKVYNLMFYSYTDTTQQKMLAFNILYVIHYNIMQYMYIYIYPIVDTFYYLY